MKGVFFTICCIILLTGCSLCQDSQMEEIVLLNCDTLDRREIARLLLSVKSFKPKVVGLDFLFNERKDFADDARLVTSLYNCPNLVMARLVHHSLGSSLPSSFVQMPPEFLPETARFGFVNADVENDTRSIKGISTVQLIDGNTEYHFSVRIAMVVDSIQTLRFLTAYPNYLPADCKSIGRNFKIFQASDVLKGKIKMEDVYGKILLIGFIGPGDEDRFNISTNGKECELYGVEFLAGVITQIVNFDR